MAKGITEVISDFKILHPRAYERIYKQGRVDAIDEYKKKIEFEEKWLFDCKVFNPNVTTAFETLKKYGEDLKEQI